MVVHTGFSILQPFRFKLSKVVLVGEYVVKHLPIAEAPEQIKSIATPWH